MMVSRDAIEIGLLIYPGAQLSAVHGLTDLFAVASRLAAACQDGEAAAFRVSHWRLSADGGAVEPVPDPDAAALQPMLAALIVPPSLAREPLGDRAIPLTRWIGERHAAGAVVCSVCAGAFLLAETRLLDGRMATTHWALAETFAERFPDITLDADKLVVDDGDIITAGGVMAWVDLGLRLVERLVGPSVMQDTARFLLVDPGGREQRFYRGFAPKLRHGDAAVLKVQHWLQSHGGGKPTLPMMASHAGLGERTFLRRFHKATGLNPSEYLQHLRVGKAREILESSATPIEQVAWAVGYGDPGAFRKVFHKLVGLSPGEYRRRFGISQAR
ncbi:AraC family transcriptional regulator [Skermanella stibiiresistens SB22]|uniref:AraC family transcriptional regulator n=1 Tax=Skermanella stibiiresistens SB22 TaxID=1385369 RepID=W9H5I8_9PROT|nr:GlxA family transcriptional regulator [Skermanella stibiiresistens]EWY39023.1 AraC family transcriptional regulator [Skermanella stibiiresistens SB22]